MIRNAIVALTILVQLAVAAAAPQFSSSMSAALSKAQTTALFTPPLAPGENNELDCYLVNVSSKPREVTIQMFTREGAGLPPVQTVLEPGHEEVAKAIEKSAEELKPRYCMFVVAGRASDVRGSVLVRTQGGATISALSAE